jgi:HEAT repeat protein
MWRRYGDDLYASLVLVAFTVEAIALGFLTWGFLFDLAGRIGGGRLGFFLVGSVAITALALITIGGYVIGYHMFSARRERGRRQRMEAWTDLWVEVLFQGQTPPQEPLPPEAEETLLDLREHLVGTEGRRVEWLVRRYRVGERLVERSRSLSHRRLLVRAASKVRRRRLSGRLDALESLAKARLALSIEPLLELLGDREASVRLMAIRSLARTLGRMPEGAHRDRAGDQFSEAILRAELPPGAVEGALLLLEDAAPRVLRRLLVTSPAPQYAGSHISSEAHAALAARVLDAVGRLKVLELADESARFTIHPQPEARAAALRALGRLGILPPAAEPALRAAFRDPVEFVRVQAARASVLLPRPVARPALWELLADESWWVRRSAATTLLGLGKEGPAGLKRAGRSHPDRYARHMAVQVLLDAGRIDAAQARSLRAAV